MALVAFDSFDRYGSSADLLENNYQVSIAAPVWSSGTGRFGGDSATRNGNDSAGSALTPKQLTTPLTTLGVGAAMQTLNPLALTNLISFYTSGTSQAHVRVNTNGSLDFLTGSVSAGTIRASSAPGVISAAAWFHIEVKITLATTATGSVEVRVNGVTVINASGIITSGSGTTCNEIRFSASVGVGSMECPMDCWVIWNTTGSVSNDFLGDIRVHTIYPTADTASTDWTRNTGANDYEAVDDTSPDDDTTYVSSSAAADKSRFDLASLPATPTSIFGVKAFAKVRKTDAGAATFQVGVFSGATEDLAIAVGPNTTYSDFEHLLTVNPDDSAAWAESDITALQVVLNRAS